MLMQRLEEASQIDRSEIETLASCHDGWCISLYLPTHEQGKEVRQDPIRLKNRLADAEALLAEAGIGGGDIDSMFGPLRDLCDFDTEENQEFWSHQGRGLGILVNQDGCRLFRLRVRTPEETIVGYRFNVRPLLRASQRDGEYGVIAVSRGAARFFEGSGDGLDETDIDDLPESLQSIVGGDHQKGFGLHSFNTGSGKSGGEEAVPHGHVDKDEFEVLRRYFNEIVEALIDADNRTGRPIAFAGVTELFPYLKDASKDTHLDIIAEPIAGNSDNASADHLHEHGWPLVEERLKARTAERLERYRSQEHTELTGSDLEEIVVAAHDGRIDLLLLKAGQRPLGSYDPTQRRVVLSEAKRDQKIDLLDVAAAKTLASGGEVRIIADDKFDLSESGAAAVYRFPMTTGE